MYLLEMFASAQDSEIPTTSTLLLP